MRAAALMESIVESAPRERSGNAVNRGRGSAPETRVSAVARATAAVETIQVLKKAQVEKNAHKPPEPTKSLLAGTDGDDWDEF